MIWHRNEGRPRLSVRSVLVVEWAYVRWQEYSAALFNVLGMSTVTGVVALARGTFGVLQAYYWMPGRDPAGIPKALRVPPRARHDIPGR